MLMWICCVQDYKKMCIEHMLCIEHNLTFTNMLCLSFALHVSVSVCPLHCQTLSLRFVFVFSGVSNNSTKTLTKFTFTRNPGACLPVPEKLTLFQ